MAKRKAKRTAKTTRRTCPTCWGNGVRRDRQRGEVFCERCNATGRV